MADKKIKGLTVEIDGDTRKLSAALSDVNKEGSTLSAELKQVDKLLKLDPSNVEALAQKQRILAEAVANSEDKLKQLHDVQGQIEQQFADGKIDRGSYLAFKNEVAATENQLKGYKEQLADVGDKAKDSGVNMDKLAEGAKKAASAVGKIGSAGLKALTEAAKAGAAAFTAYTGALGGAITGAVNLAGKAALAADDLSTLSTQTGISTEELQKYQYAADLVDVSTETLTKSMSKNIISLSSTAKATEEAYGAIGVATKNADGSLRDSQTVYWESIEALGKITDETQRDSIAMQIFGESAQELNPLIEGGAQKIQELGASAKSAGLILSQDALDSLNAYNDSLDILKANANAAGNIIGGAFTDSFIGITDVIGAAIPSMAQLVAGIFNGDTTAQELSAAVKDVATQLIEQVNNVLPSFIEGFNGIVTGVVDAIADTAPQAAQTILPALLTGFNGILKGLTGTITKSLPSIVSSAITLFKGILSGLKSVTADLLAALPTVITDITAALVMGLPELIAGAGELFTGIVDGLTGCIPSIMAYVTTIVPQIVMLLISSIPQIIDAGAQLLTGLTDGILAAIPSLIAALPEIITGIVSTLLEAIPQIINTGIQLLTSLVAALPDIITAIVAALPEIISGIITAIITSIPQIIQAGIDLFVSLIAALPDIIIAVVEAIPQIIEGIITALIGAIPQLVTAGIELFCALVANLPKIIEGIVKAIPQIIEAIKKAFTDFKWGELGINILEGIGEGLVSGVKKIGSKISEAARGLLDGFKDELGIHSPSVVFRDIVGKNIADGIGVGFTTQIKGVNEDMLAAMPKASSFTQAAGTTKAADVSTPTAPTINYVQNNYNPTATSRMAIGKQTCKQLKLAALMG